MVDFPEEFLQSNRKVSIKTRIKKVVQKRVPITEWLPKYKPSDLIADFIAGVTVGLTVVPQSMAYAAIAGLSPEYGLYSSYLGCILYVVLGSCRQVTIGPTAVMGLLTFETCGPDFPSCAILAGFYSGIFELAMAILQLGWVVSFISEPVTVGFTAGAASTILSSQVKNFMGLSGPKGSGFVGYWSAIFRDISTIHLGDTVMGVIAFITLLLLKKLKDVKVRNKILKKAFWLISVARNVIIVIVTTCIAYSWPGTPPFKLTGKVQGGFPTISPPIFTLPYNSTYPDDTRTFVESLEYLGTGPLVIALISILQNVAISKAFGSGQSVDATQEMFALGASNIIGGFFSAIPTSGSFSRSAVNDSSGVRSPLGGLFTGILVLLSLGLLTPTFYFIPKAGLAAVIISAVISMIEVETLLPMWRISKIDCISCVVTFFCALFLGMEYGIIVGVGLSIGSLLFSYLKPSLKPELRSLLNEEDGPKLFYLLLRPANGLSFPSVDFVRGSLNKLVLKYEPVSAFVVDFDKWNTFDYTAATALVSLVKGFEKSKKTLVFMNASHEWIQALQAIGLDNPPVCKESELAEFLWSRRYEPIEPVIGTVEKSSLKNHHFDHNPTTLGQGDSNSIDTESSSGARSTRRLFF